MTTEYCIVTNVGASYTTYDEWIRKNFGWYMSNFKYNHDITDIKSERLYKIIGHAPHGGCQSEELYLIQDIDTEQVFIIGEDGILITTTATIKNTNTIYRDDSLDATRYTYNIRGGEGNTTDLTVDFNIQRNVYENILKGGERNMNDKIVDLYYERKREGIIKKYENLVKDEYEALAVVNEYTELINTFEASLAEMANRYNTEDTHALARTGYGVEYTYELADELKDKIKESHRDEYNNEIRELELLVEEVRAVLSISDADEYRIGVLTEYGIITKKGKLNV